MNDFFVMEYYAREVTAAKIFFDLRKSNNLKSPTNKIINHNTKLIEYHSNHHHHHHIHTTNTINTHCLPSFLILTNRNKLHVAQFGLSVLRQYNLAQRPLSSARLPRLDFPPSNRLTKHPSDPHHPNHPNLPKNIPSHPNHPSTNHLPMIEH